MVFAEPFFLCLLKLAGRKFNDSISITAHEKRPANAGRVRRFGLLSDYRRVFLTFAPPWRTLNFGLLLQMT